MTRLLAFETHPIQYRAPIFQAIERAAPGELLVVYASDFSVRGYSDEGFGQSFAWDVPLMKGYQSRVLHNEVGRGIASWRGLTARGVDKLISENRPDAVLLHSLSYRYCLAAYWSAWRRRIPVWIRLETQDEAFERGALKGFVRSIVYRCLYAGVGRAFYIGELSRRHLLQHGVPEHKLRAARYCTADRQEPLSRDQKREQRVRIREQLGIPADSVVIAFVGKLIRKKNPDLLLKAVLAAQGAQRNWHLLFVGSGELEPELRKLADSVGEVSGIQSTFSGFVNQSGLPGMYLGSDVVVLPSRRMGETWGLVINEALQAGCAAVVTDAVGCSRDFGSWERVRVIHDDDAGALLRALTELSAMPRDFEWARDRMAQYSVEASATAFLRELDAASEGGERVARS